MLGNVILLICGMIVGAVVTLGVLAWLAEKITGRVW